MEPFFIEIRHKLLIGPVCGFVESTTGILTGSGLNARLAPVTQSNIYFDFNATTPPDPLIQDHISHWMSLWGNPSSVYQQGRDAKKLLRWSRREIAQKMDCHPLELVFTSSGSESNNLALKGFCRAFCERGSKRSKILMGTIEHPSVLKQAPWLESMGFQVIFIPIKPNGEYDLDFYKEHLDEKVALVSLMLANNEVGVIAPIKKMVAQAHTVGAFFHSDMVQALGKYPFDLKTLDVDMASFSSHKIYALKGSGLLYVKKGTPLMSLVEGGPQERRRRAGTENLMATASFALMINHLDPQEFVKKLTPLRDEMEERLVKTVSGLEVLCKGQKRLANTSNFIVPGVSAESLLINLDVRGFSVGTGAACSSGNTEPSPVHLALGLTYNQAQSSLRVSLGKDTKREEVLSLVRSIGEVAQHLYRLEQNKGECRESVL